MAEVYVDNKYAGSVENAEIFVKQFIEKRRNKVISYEANIYYDKVAECVFIECDSGRARRPLIIVKEGKSALTDEYVKELEKNKMGWNDLITKGVIEYLDAAEEENTLVALSEEELTPEHTHLEISPMDMLSLTTSLVPYGNYSPGARINMGAKNQKQAIGLYAANYLIRIDTDVNILHQPHIPIVTTDTHQLFDYDKHPAGQNVIVAVMSYKGYNMDDAIIINRGSIERGMARSTYFRPAVAQELRYPGGLIDEIGIPDKEVKGYKTETDYRLLEEDGIIFVEAKVKEDDVIIGKTSPPRFLSSMEEYSLAASTRRESSLSMKHGERGVVDFILITESEEGNKLIQTRIRDQRIPEIGDKFTSRHGQKGVIGLIVDEKDMPFTTSGTKPDIIFSPHGIPSRMTISHLLEILGGKVGSLSGRYIDGTTFDSEDEKDLRKELLSRGFREDGTETLYNGETGEQLQSKIFIGTNYYQKLKHMVANKLHARAMGPVQLLTRQPTEGRAKEGGLRLGEMEKDAFIAHGASLLLKERFDSDKTIVPACNECGLIAVYDEFKNKSYCPVCGENVDIDKIELSYAFKLLLDEFKTLGVYPQIKLRSKY